MSLVSIIMNCHNGEKYLAQAIDSVYSQTYKNWEIIFWDNASKDLTRNIVGKYDQKIKYYYSSNYEPLGNARNAALNVANGRYIAFLDVDDYWEPTKLEQQVRLLDENHKVGLVYSDAWCEIQGKGVYRFFSGYKKMPPRGMILPYLLRNNIICMPSVMLRRVAILEQSIFFDPMLEIYPDYDLFRRIADKWELDYINEAMVTYRIHSDSSTTRNYDKTAKELRRALHNFVKYIPGFRQKYEKEINFINNEIIMQQSKILWKNQKNREARLAIRSTYGCKRYLFMYLCTFFSYNFVCNKYYQYRIFVNKLVG